MVSAFTASLSSSSFALDPPRYLPLVLLICLLFARHHDWRWLHDDSVIFFGAQETGESYFLNAVESHAEDIETRAIRG